MQESYGDGIWCRVTVPVPSLWTTLRGTLLTDTSDAIVKGEVLLSSVR